VILVFVPRLAWAGPFSQLLGFRFKLKIKNHVSRWAETSNKCFRYAPSHVFNILKIVFDGEIQIQRCAIAQAQRETDSIPAPKNYLLKKKVVREWRRDSDSPDGLKIQR
jgi:hypothetical protein